MHQSKNGNHWHVGMNAHIGIDAASGLVHTVVGAAGSQVVEKRPYIPGKSVTLQVLMKKNATATGVRCPVSSRRSSYQLPEC